MRMARIHGNIPSSKNSKVATSKGVFHSKTVGKFLREQGIQSYSVTKRTVALYKTRPCIFPVDELKAIFKDVVYPVEVGIHFIRKTKADFDFHNACQILFDLMVAFEIIPDDSMRYVIPRALPWPYEEYDDEYEAPASKWYTISKNNPGCIIALPWDVY